MDGHALRVDEVVIVCVDVRVIDRYEAALGLLKGHVELLNLVDGPCVLVELEVLEILRVVQVRPQNVHREAIISKLLVAFNHQVRTIILILAVVVAQ